MSRPLRLEFASALYHITSRGNARNLIYLQDDDFELFLQFLAIVCERYNWVVHADARMLGSGLVFCISSFLDYGCLIHI
ncbi:MAG: REP element-mobilizing transposase RayT [Sediminicola sp.]|jgi:REP element-mobilizing transposase RayT